MSWCHFRISRSGIVGLAVIAVAACGSQSPANNSANAATPTTKSAANAAGIPAVVAGTLPIEQGIYGSVEGGSCARASLVFFYDGANYGYVKQADPGPDGAGAYSEVNPIHRVGTAAPQSDFYDHYRGYTLVWNMENADREEDILGIKAGSHGGFTSIEVSRGGAGREMISEEAYQKCGFDQLSPGMQATIRAERPQLAGAATGQAGTRPPIEASVAFPPIEKGYYAIQMSCSEAVADPYLTLVYIDEKRMSAGDGGTDTLGFRNLGNGRYERSYRAIDPDGKSYTDRGVIAVNSRTSFTVEYDDGEHITHTHCPTTQIPKSERMEWGDLSRTGTR